MDFAKLSEIIEHNSIRSVDELIKKLPEEYLKYYTFLYDSHSLQPASPSFPRTVVYGPDARFMMSFSGDPNHSAYQTIETIELDEKDYKFHFRHVEFDPTGKTKPKIVNSPPICNSCHGKDPQPIWDAYPMWRGAYGSRSANKFDRIAQGTPESKFYESFLKNQRCHGRYRLFPLMEETARLKKKRKQKEGVVTITKNGAVSDPTAFLSEQLGEIMLRRAAKEIKAHPNFEKIKPALVFAALCERHIPMFEKVGTADANGKNITVIQDNSYGYISSLDYLPREHAEKMSQFLEEYKRFVKEEGDYRIKELSFYNKQSDKKQQDGYEIDEADGDRNFPLSYPEYKATWIYLYGLMGLDPRKWTMSFDHGALTLEEGGPPAYSRLGYLLFHDDPSVQALYGDTNQFSGPGNSFRFSSKETCELLKEQSKAALNNFTATGNPFAILKPKERSRAEGVLPPSVPKAIFRCLECHGLDGIAPAIPLEKPEQLSLLLNSPLHSGKPTLGKDLIFQIESGNMPRGSKLTLSEKQAILEYLRKLQDR